MNHGLYMSAAGMLTNMHRQDVTANNLANVETAGFKRDLVSFLQREPEAFASGRFELSHQLMDQLGGTTWVNRSRSDLSPGVLEQTGKMLDLGIEGEGFFVVEQMRDGEAIERLTRDGRLKVDAAGRLAASTSGLPLLDVEGEAIVVDPTRAIQVNERGVVLQDDVAVGQLRLASVADPLSLRSLGEGLFEAEAGVLANAEQAGGLVRQGMVERSNVEAIREMLQMIEATRAISQNATMMQHHDGMMDRAVNVLGRVA